jgi:hypothetical protein
MSLNRTRSVETYSLGADPQTTPPTSPLLLLGDVTVQAYAAGATQQRLYASRIMTPHLLFHAAITYQRLFVYLHSPCLEQLRHNMYFVKILRKY